MSDDDKDSEPSLLKLYTYGLIASWVLKEEDTVDYKDQPWLYKCAHPFRFLAGMAVVYYTNYVLHNALGAEPNHFSILWGFLVAYIPFVGSVMSGLLVLFLIWLGIPAALPPPPLY